MNTRPMLAVAYGTRPQVIKTARLLPALRRRWSVMTIDTGQHYDYELNALLYEQLGVTAPDLVLGVGSGPRDEQLERIQAGCLPLLQAARPRAMVVIGDTNSTLGSALAAARVGIPVVHVEAGLRSHVGAMAEEQNRRQVDALSALLCTPSVAADAWLAAEHLPGRVARTGDVARDVLEFARCAGTIPVALPDWPLAPGEGYLFATLHRAELTNDADRLGGAIETLSRLPLPVVIAVHPRTHHRMAELRIDSGSGSLDVVPPLGYLEALAAVQGARAVVTDSGGIQRAYWLGVRVSPCAARPNGGTVSLGANRRLPRIGCVNLPGAVMMALDAPRTGAGQYGTGTAAGRSPGDRGIGMPERLRPDEMNDARPDGARRRSRSGGRHGVVVFVHSVMVHVQLGRPRAVPVACPGAAGGRPTPIGFIYTVQQLHRAGRRTAGRPGVAARRCVIGRVTAAGAGLDDRQLAAFLWLAGWRSPGRASWNDALAVCCWRWLDFRPARVRQRDGGPSVLCGHLVPWSPRMRTA